MGHKTVEKRQTVADENDAGAAELLRSKIRLATETDDGRICRLLLIRDSAAADAYLHERRYILH